MVFIVAWYFGQKFRVYQIAIMNSDSRGNGSGNNENKNVNTFNLSLCVYAECTG